MNKFKIGDRVLVNMNPQHESEAIRERLKSLAGTLSQFEHKSAEVTTVYNGFVYELNGKFLAVEDVLLPADEKEEKQADDTITISKNDFIDKCAEFIKESPLSDDDSGDLKIIAMVICVGLTGKLFGKDTD